MIEVLWHGRGGQGAFTAARLLGAAASLEDGRHALAFPAFGPERRGAPIRAFTKMADAPIGNRSALAQADYVVYLDDTLLGDGWECELEPGGRVLVNSTRAFDDPRITAIDADGISSAILGRPIPNTVLLGALAALCDRVDLDDVKEAIHQYMPAKLHAKNIAIVEEACAACRREQGAQGHSSCPEQHAQQPLSCHPERSTQQLSSCHPERAQRVEGSRAASAESASGLTARTVSFDSGGFAASAQDDISESGFIAPAQEDKRVSTFDGSFRGGKGGSVLSGSARDGRGAACIPTLRSGDLDPREFAHSTCFEGGYLTVKNAGWRNIRPVIDPASCTGCLQCYLYCPDGAVYKVPSALQPTERADAAASRGTRFRGDGEGLRTEVRGASAIPTISGTTETLADATKPVTKNILVEIDYDFCKGCGVCAKACKFGAITMISESEADERPLCHPEHSTAQLAVEPRAPRSGAQGAAALAAAESKDPVRRQPADGGTQQQESEVDAR